MMHCVAAIVAGPSPDRRRRGGGPGHRAVAPSGLAAECRGDGVLDAARMRHAAPRDRRPAAAPAVTAPRRTSRRASTAATTRCRRAPPKARCSSPRTAPTTAARAPCWPAGTGVAVVRGLLRQRRPGRRATRTGPSSPAYRDGARQLGTLIARRAADHRARGATAGDRATSSSGGRVGPARRGADRPRRGRGIAFNPPAPSARRLRGRRVERKRPAVDLPVAAWRSDARSRRPRGHRPRPESGRARLLGVAANVLSVSRSAGRACDREVRVVTGSEARPVHSASRRSRSSKWS